MKTILLLLVALAIPALARAQDEAAEKGCRMRRQEYSIVKVKTDKKSHPKGQVESGQALVYVFNDISGISPGYPSSRVGLD